MRECRLAKCLFGASTLNFKGSCVSGRDNSKDLIADYFGLGRDSQSSVSFSPRIQNFVVDFQLYLGLNEWWNGLYFRVNAPLTASWCHCKVIAITTAVAMAQTATAAATITTTAAQQLQQQPQLFECNIKPKFSIPCWLHEYCTNNYC